MSGLLHRQLASITNTLVKESERQKGKGAFRQQIVARHCSHDVDIMNDLRQMLVELGRRDTRKASGKDSEDHIRLHATDHLNLAKIRGLSTATNKIITGHVKTVGQYPKETLKEMDQPSMKRSGVNFNGNYELGGLKAMLANIEEQRPDSCRDLYKDMVGDFEAAHGKATTTQPPSPLLARQHHLLTTGYMSALGETNRSAMTRTLDAKIVPYAVALMLESSGCLWEEVKDWCKHLFSNKQEAKEVAEKEEELNATIAYGLSEDRHAIQLKSHIACRVILSS